MGDSELRKTILEVAINGIRGVGKSGLVVGRTVGMTKWRPRAVVLLLLLIHFPCFGGEYFVSPAGDDRNPGTLERPFSTIQKAVEVAQPGDVVYIRAGIYPGIRIFPAGGIGKSGTAERPIVYRAFGDGDAIIRGMVWIEAEYIEFYGLKITNPRGHGVFLCGKRTPAGSGTLATNHIRFAHCEIYECMGIGVLTDYDVHHNEFLFCDVHHNGKRTPPKDGEGQGFYVGGDYNLFIGNEIHDNADNGLQIWASKGWGEDIANPTGNIVLGNRVYGNGFAVNMAGIVVGASCGGDSNLVAYNTIFGNRTYGLHIASSLGKDNWFVHNTIFGNETGIAIYSSAGPNTVVLNNVVYGNPINLTVWKIPNKPDHLSTLLCDYNLWDPDGEFNWAGTSYGKSFARYQSGSGQDRHSLVGNPVFVDALRGDFRLREGSPAIDAALPLQVIEAQEIGFAVPHGIVPDIGAYESTPGLHVFVGVALTGRIAPVRAAFCAVPTGGVEPCTYTWDFGDGTTAVGGPWIEHLYDQPGTYATRVVVTDNSGVKGEAAIDVEVAGVSVQTPEAHPVVKAVRFGVGTEFPELVEIVPGVWYRVQLVLEDPASMSKLSRLVLFLCGPGSAEPLAIFDPQCSYGVQIDVDGRVWVLETPGDSVWTDISGQTGLWVDVAGEKLAFDTDLGIVSLSLRLLPDATPGRWYVFANVQDIQGGWTSSRFPITVLREPELTARIVAEGPVADSSANLVYRVHLITSRPVVRTPAPLYFVDGLGNRHPVIMRGAVPGTSFHGVLRREEASHEGWGHFELAPGALVDSLGNSGFTITEGQSLLLDWPPKKVANVVAQP